MLTLILYSIVKEQIFYDSLYTIYYNATYYFYILEITGIEPVTWLRPLSRLSYQFQIFF
jgi:hypothetical protein